MTFNNENISKSNQIKEFYIFKVIKILYMKNYEKY
jgi:hypothetical protein